LNKIFVISNPLNHEGGIANYYNLFLKHFKSNTVRLSHKSIGSRHFLFYYPVIKRLLYPFFYIYDLIKFVLLFTFTRSLVAIQVSPSLIPVPLIRDGLLVMLSKLSRKHTIIFFRGWKINTLNTLQGSKFFRSIFKQVYLRNTTILVLAKSFKNDLIKLGANKEQVTVTTTAIDKDQLHEFSNAQRDAIKVLFLGRLSQLKGIQEILETIIELNLNGDGNNFIFTLAGHSEKDGFIDIAREKLDANAVPKTHYNFTGRIDGPAKFKLYAEHDVFILPSYTEGCPTSVLEALASGLYCLTTNVGALNEIIQPGVNGDFINVGDSLQIVNQLQKIKLQIKKIRDQRMQISQQSIESFDIEAIIRRLRPIYENVR